MYNLKVTRKKFKSCQNHSLPGYHCADIDKILLAEILSQANERTFNRITVDGDTSTNDTVIILANGAAGNPVILKGTQEEKLFSMGIVAVMEKLAEDIVLDGEGATKFVTVRAFTPWSSISTLVYAASRETGPILPPSLRPNAVVSSSSLARPKVAASVSAEMKPPCAAAIRPYISGAL